MLKNKSILLLTLALCALSSIGMGAKEDELARGFQNPPDSAKPHTWWHWCNDNITKEGITADLEAMKRVGVGGAQIFNVDVGVPAGRVKFMSAEWREMIQHAVKEADRLGIELCIHNCGGWSSSGGPWVEPQHAMLIVTTSETRVKGPARFSDVLPQPQTRRGFYRDIATLAFRTPQGNLRIENVQGKAAYQRADNIQPSGSSTAPPEAVIKREAIVDLTSRMEASGRLTWDVPEGEWTILRIGYTPTGKDNHPATPEARGLEVDKLSREALDAFWAGMMATVINDIGPLAGKSLNNALVDSYEVGSQNWTPRFREEFQKRRGYDLLPYFPVFTGRVVDSPEISERFLWDVRRTVADLFADNYFGYFGELCHKHGLLFSTEPYGNGAFEDITCGGRADIPMGEFWIGGGARESCKLAASTAHVYGRKIVGAESFTATPEQGRWQQDPYSMKALGDLIYCMGVNRFIFHRYAHQPWMNVYPGMTMGQWGFHFERTNTWWEQGAAWLKYLARCQYLLQQGLFVADVLYFVGEHAPVSMPLHPELKAKGYDYDGCSAEVIMRLTVKNGRLMLPDGMSYRVLVLPNSEYMTPPLLRKIRELVQSGATVIGPKPKKSPSLNDYPKCDEEVQRLADEVWGKGKVIEGKPVEEVLATMGVKPDFEYGKENLSASLNHRLEVGVYNGSRSLLKQTGRRALRNESALADFDSAANSGRRTLRNESASADFRSVVSDAEFDSAANSGRRTLRNESALADFRSVVSDADFDSAAKVDSSRQSNAKLEFIHRVVGDTDIYFVSNQRARVEEVDVTFRVSGKTPKLWHPDTGKREKAAVYVEKDGRITIPLRFEPAGSVFVVFRKSAVEAGVSARPHFVAVSHAGARQPKSSAPKLEIRRAIYEAIDGAGSADVTERVKAMVRDGTLSLNANNQMMGGDPTPNHLKRLRVEYLLNGTPHTVIVNENEDLELPPPSGRSEFPVYELALAADGKAELKAWQPGVYEFKSASGKTQKVEVKNVAKPLEVTGQWELSFPPNWGAPPKVTLDKLISWTEHSDPGVRYFSGTATYTKEFDIPKEMLNPRRAIYLDLGRVKNLCEVTVNGKDFGVLWKPPFRVDITGVARAGKNRLEIRVTNLWVNRLIGDEQFPDDSEWQGKRLRQFPQWFLEGKPRPSKQRLTFTTWKHWTKDSPLLESGLLGPVTVRAVERVSVQP